MTARRLVKEALELYRSGLSTTKLLARSDWSESERERLRAACEHARGLRRFDSQSRRRFDRCSVIGVDEVGRGPLAGPLVACAYIGKPTRRSPLPFLRDSKKLRGQERELLRPLLQEQAERYAFGWVEPAEFSGSLNLHHLTFLAMQRALDGLALPDPSDHLLLVDGRFPLPGWSGAQRSVVGGDDRSFAVAAASVLAKLERDRSMREAHLRYPEYGFDRHVGYGTVEHRRALLAHGPCPLHRTTFLTGLLAGGSDLTVPAGSTL